MPAHHVRFRAFTSRILVSAISFTTAVTPAVVVLPGAAMAAAP
ncbi:hypothetical protein [Streptomyces sp. NPDC005548]